MSKFLNQAKSSKLQLALCPVTGLSIELSIPAIPLKVLTYQNPLAIPANAIGIAKLSYKEKTSLSKEVLAGALLTLLNHYQLIEDKLSSIERNELLTSCSYYQLHSILIAIVSSSKYTIRNWPHLSLEGKESAHSPTSAILQNYLNIITGKYEIEAKYTVSTVEKKKKEKKLKSVPKLLRARIRELSSALSPLLTTKIQQVLIVVAQGNNLYSLHSTLRHKLVLKLQALETAEALELAQIIKNAEKEEEENEVTSSFVEDRPRLSLKEILAAKISSAGAKLPEFLKEEEKEEEEKEKEEEEEEKITKIEDLFYPSFKHADCDSCEYEMSSCKSLSYCYHIEQQKEAQTASILGTIKEIADELGIENNLEYIEEDFEISDLIEDEKDEELDDSEELQDEEGDDDEF